MMDLGTTLEVGQDENSTQDRLERKRSEADRSNISDQARRGETGMHPRCSRLGLETEFENQCVCVLEDKRTVDVEAGTADPSGSSDLLQI